MHTTSKQLICTLIIFAIATSATADDKKKKAPPKRRPNSPMAKVEDVAGLPRILLVGDSISIGYTVPVRELLKGKANVHRPLTNCGPTTKGVAEIDKWLGDGKWDVIHFNWGLHDLKYMGAKNQNLADPNDKNSHQQVPPKEYEANLRKLVDSAKYNEIAAKIMKEHSIPTDDHYSYALKNQKEIQLPANVHFGKKGSQELAKKTVAAILNALSE